MRILLCHKDIGCGPAGGFSTLYTELAYQFMSLGHQVAIVTGRQGPRVTGIERILITHSDRTARRKEIADVVHAWSPDIVECPSWGAELLAYIHMPKHAHVFLRGDIPARYFLNSEYAHDEEILARKAHTIIAISSWCQKEWASIVGKNVAVVPHGVTTPPASTAPKDEKLIVWVGKATWMKGIDLLAEIAPHITTAYRLVCVIAPDRYEQQERVEKLRHAGATIVSHLSNDAYQTLLAQATFILSTARREGFCLALLEGMAHGAIPVVPDWIGGALDFVTPDLGIIYQSIHDLPKILPIPDIRNALDLRAQARSYSWARTAHESLLLYQQAEHPL